MRCDLCDGESGPFRSRETFNFCEDKEACDLRRSSGTLRPHSIHGWWQVWMGNICIALLAPEEGPPFDEVYARGWNDAIRAAVQECDGEYAACERHHKVQPRRLNHKVGMQIASVCARRVSRLRPKNENQRSDG